MDDRKRSRRIILLFILILLIAASLFIARMAGSHTQDGNGVPETEAAAAAEETLPGEDMTAPKDLSEDTEEEVPEDTGEKSLDEEAQEAGEDEAVARARQKRSADERYVEYRRNIAAKSREKEKDKESSKDSNLEQEETEEPYVPPTIMIVSDLHYISPEMHDSGMAFWEMVMEDDGKLSPYSDLILEAMIDEAIERNVSALVMAGDNTLNGERENHEKLAQSLKRLLDAGIPVLLVPGNHDINNTNAAYYFGDESEEAEYLHSADEYYEIYADFYEGANSRDPNSLSYVYPLDETHWMMLLDSAWYEDKMHVAGRIRPGTLLWMEEVFDAAEEAGAMVIPVAHHNLLSESRVYTKECIIENADEVTELLESYHVPVYLSGHLHAQRIKKHKSQPGVPDDEYGITEIVSSPLSIAPCQYGILSWDDDDRMHYEVFSLAENMDETGQYIGSETDIDTDFDGEEIWTFEPFAEGFTKMVIVLQVQDNYPSLPMEIAEQIGACYADMYYLYSSGSYIDWDGFTLSEGYRLLRKYTGSDGYLEDIYEMSRDNTTDYHRWDQA